MTSTDSLIHALSADLVPVRRRRISREVAGLAVLVAIEAVLLLSTGAMRADMGQVLLAPFMVWKMGSLALLAGVACVVALRSFAPPAVPRRGLLLLLWPAALALGCGMVVTPTIDAGRPFLTRLSPVDGMLCAAAIFVLATPILAAFALMMRRAAPVRPRQSALASGIAAATLAALIFTLCCPMNDPLYIAVWYSVGVASVAFLSRWILPRRFRL